MKKVIKYIRHFFNKTKEKHPEINSIILKSCLVYQYLYQKHFNEYISIEKILDLNNGEIGLIGPGNGCITWFFEKTLGQIDILHSHSIMHDAFGRFYNNYTLDRGYTYVISENKTTKFMKRSPLCGQITGILYCICNKIII